MQSKLLSKHGAGELPPVDLRVTAAELKALRANPRLRSPFGFVKAKLTGHSG